MWASRCSAGTGGPDLIPSVPCAALQGGSGFTEVVSLVHDHTARKASRQEQEPDLPNP